MTDGGKSEALEILGVIERPKELFTTMKRVLRPNDYHLQLEIHPHPPIKFIMRFKI